MIAIAVALALCGLVLVASRKLVWHFGAPFDGRVRVGEKNRAPHMKGTPWFVEPALLKRIVTEERRES